MNNDRILFEKEGRGRYISHLDLVRTMQRVFVREGVSIWHTEGFNPHPYMTFALPLSVGTDSICELMDFQLTDETPLAALPDKLNASLPDGIRVRAAYRAERKFTELAFLRVSGLFEYDRGGAPEFADKLGTFFSAESLLVLKRTKRGESEFDLAPHLHDVSFKADGETRVRVSAVLPAQNPSLNPMLLADALSQRCPELSPDFCRFRREETLDAGMNIFR